MGITLQFAVEEALLYTLYINHTHSNLAVSTQRSIVSKQNCPGFEPRQFCLNTINNFVLKTGFELVWLT